KYTYRRLRHVAAYATTYVTEELRSQVVEAEAATATASQRPRTTLRPINEATIEEIDEESEEELYDSDLDELAL
ncbi:hypothetical protein V498_02084, partial [Pseudogymnoascus sp. VKM F-4517 (FW-2822)]